MHSPTPPLRRAPLLVTNVEGEGEEGGGGGGGRGIARITRGPSGEEGESADTHREKGRNVQQLPLQSAHLCICTRSTVIIRLLPSPPTGKRLRLRRQRASPLCIVEAAPCERRPPQPPPRRRGIGQGSGRRNSFGTGVHGGNAE